MDIFKIIISFLSDNMWIFFLMFCVYVFRDGFSSFITRLTSLSYRNGNSELGMEAAVLSNEKEGKKLGDFISTDEKPLAQSEDSDIEVKTKKESWFLDIYMAFKEGRVEDAEMAFNRYAVGEKDAVKLEERKAAYLYLKFEKGKDNSAIDELKDLMRTAKTDETKFSCLVWLSFSLDSCLQYKSEIELWRKMICEINDPLLTTKAIVYLSNALNKDGQSSEAKRILIQRLSVVEEDEHKSRLYDALSKIEKTLGNNIISIYCKDKSLEFSPHDREELFNAAYSASDDDVDELSISNYLRLIRIDGENAMALNNLGVRANEAGLKVIAVDNYKKSAEHNNTLAMANQGYLLLNAGFIEEAEDIVKKALCQEDVHQNIHSLKISINERREEQEKAWAELSEKSLSRQKLIRKYIGKYYIGESNKFNGGWFVNGVTPIKIVVNDSVINTSWEEPVHEKSDNTYTVTLNGVVSGESFSGKYSKCINGEGSKGLMSLNGNTSNSCIGFISDDGETLTFIGSNVNDSFSLFLSRKEIVTKNK
ncbi:tetratricopeptide repeat protein [Aeromonas enteropelogenes]|uniref:tetratricopeptide repeat protein n=1 Tax=Aeromonas enteropelogenes TaxID=29489 RepID=UPI003BA1DBD0